MSKLILHVYEIDELKFTFLISRRNLTAALLSPVNYDANSVPDFDEGKYKL